MVNWEKFYYQGVNTKRLRGGIGLVSAFTSYRTGELQSLEKTPEYELK